MIPGAFRIGDDMVGQAVLREAFPGSGDLLGTAKQALNQPHPWLTLWDVNLPDGTTNYYCDFGDPDARSAVDATYVTFLTNEYATVNVVRTEFRQDTDGQSTVTVTFHDPLRTIMTLFRDNDMDGQIVTMRITRYDLLEYGDEYTVKHDFRVKSASFQAGPDIAAVTLGMPNLFALNFPRQRFNRRRCFNDFNLRYEVGNACTYPSDEFEGLTEQDLDEQISADTATAVRYGWSVLNGSTGIQSLSTNNETSVDHPYVGSGDASEERTLWFFTNRLDTRWDDATQNGPFLYKTFGDDAAGDEDTDFDVHVKVRTRGAQNTKGEYQFGILCQSVDDTSDWIFWAIVEDSLSALQYRSRVTTNGTSVDTDVAAGASHLSGLRMQRSGTTWTLYTRNDDDWSSRDESTASWTQQRQETFTITGAVRLGVFGASDDSGGSGNLQGEFAFVRFTSGAGFSTCNRSLTDCQARDNEAQFNGFLGMPDGITFVR